MAVASPGFHTCRGSRRPWRDSVQERFRNVANIAVTIVKRRKEFLIGTQILFGVPLQMAIK
jgi:hypothetical protein